MDPSSKRVTCKKMKFFTVKTQSAESWQTYNTGFNVLVNINWGYNQVQGMSSFTSNYNPNV